MIKIVKFALVVFFAFQIKCSSAQTVNIDSLENTLKQHTNSDTAKVNLLNKIAFAYLNKNIEKLLSNAFYASKLSDSLNFPEGKSESLRIMGIGYTRTDTVKALAYFNESIKIAESIASKIQIARSLGAMGILYGVVGQNIKAVECYQKTIAIATELNDNQIKAKNYINLAQAYNRMGNSSLAIESYNKALDAYELFDDKLGMASCYNSLGNLYEIQGNFPLAVDCGQKGLKIREELNDKAGISTSLISIAGLYFNQKNYEKALDCLKRSLQIAEEIKEQHNIAACLLNIGFAYLETNSPEALEYLQRALDYSEKLNIVSLKFSALSFMGSYYSEHQNYDKALEFYFKALDLVEKYSNKPRIGEITKSIANVYFKKKQYALALKYAQRSLPIAEKTKQLKLRKGLHYLLSQIYAVNGNYKEAYSNSIKYSVLSDSVYNEGNVRQIAELEYKYKYEKEKQMLELEQQKKDAMQVAEKKQQSIILLSFILAFALMSALAFYIYQAYRIKRQSNISLAIQKNEIEAKNLSLVQLNNEIVAQQEEIASQRDMVVAQKNKIQVQNKEITDSIDYAKHIQQALLPLMEPVEGLVDEYFVLHKPKDIVSGDFYWNTQVDNYLVVAVADCTGHGVPGAFMSVLGVSLLNEIVRKRQIVKANEILNELRTSVIEALKQKWQSGEQKDGMDIAIVIINTQNSELQYAGAHIPLFIFNQQNGLAEIKSDKQTVAINIKMVNFTNNVFTLSKGDCIYLATDGYYDQFGGSDNVKFKKKQLVELISEIANKPMDEQARILNDRFENWRGNKNQTDDVTIVGLRV